MSELETVRRIHVLPKLPYEMDALEPYISKETLNYHYGKHHHGYVDKLNKLVIGTDFEDSDLDEIVKNADGPLFNNAAQVWNHTFYWNGLSPTGGIQPKRKLAEAIGRDFGSTEMLIKEFNKQALAKFGSGWTWLIKNSNGTLAIRNTDDADTPLRHNQQPLLTCDVWEHAYYLDHRNDRAKYLEAFWRLVNWRFVERNFRVSH